MITTTDSQEEVRQAVERLLGAMCERPGDVRVELAPSERRPVLTVSVNQVDYGAVLGKHRSMLEALQLLAALAGARRGLSGVEVILDKRHSAPANGAVRRRQAAAEPWDQAPFEAAVGRALESIFDEFQFDVRRVSSEASRLTITLQEDPPFREEDRPRVERALEAVFNCVGAMQGRRILVELVA